MKEYIAKVAEGENLTEEEAKGAMDIMLSGDATQAQIAAFLALERVKGETLDELAGFAVVLRDKAETISPKVDNYIDLVGTGGDRTFTFNVSTTSAFVVAAAGLPVAKHGNRSISSKSGAGDVLEALGVNIMADPKKVVKKAWKDNEKNKEVSVYGTVMKLTHLVTKLLPHSLFLQFIGRK